MPFATEAYPCVVGMSHIYTLFFAFFLGGEIVRILLKYIEAQEVLVTIWNEMRYICLGDRPFTCV